MIFEAFLLYGLAVLILLSMRRRVKNKSLDDLIHESHHHHQQLGAVYAKHSTRGDWKKYQSWVQQKSDVHPTN